MHIVSVVTKHAKKKEKAEHSCVFNTTFDNLKFSRTERKNNNSNGSSQLNFHFLVLKQKNK